MDYEHILRRSWEIARTHKFLWVFGMALAAFSAGGSNLNLSGGGDSGNIADLFRGKSVEQLPQEGGKVLGAYTDRLLEVFRSIPLWVWLVLAVSLLVAVLVAIAVSLFVRNWAKGSLISAIHDLEDQKRESLTIGSRQGLAVVKRFIWLNLVPWLLLLVTIILILALLVITALLTPQAKEFAGLLAVAAVLGMVIVILVGGVFVSLSITIAEQLVIRKDLPASQAFSAAARLVRRHLKEVVTMGAINLGIGCALGCATLILLLLFAALTLIAFSVSQKVGAVVAILIGIPLIIIVLSSLLIRGIYAVFNTATWTLLFRELESQEEKGASHA